MKEKWITVSAMILVFALTVSMAVMAKESSFVLGDVNGDNHIDSMDALLVLQHSVGLISLSQAQKTAADVTGDDEINAEDALFILQYSVGLCGSFPADYNKPHVTQVILPSSSMQGPEPVYSRPVTSVFYPNSSAASEPNHSIVPEPDNSPKVVEINPDNFPDHVFRNDVMAFDLNRDGWLSENEIAKVTKIDVSRYDVWIPEKNPIFREPISSLKGIEHFTQLKFLLCYNNNLIALDVSNNRKLERLDCSCNHLIELDIQSNSELDNLDCFSNQLTELDCSRNLKLRALTCKYNQISELDLTNNSALTYLLHDEGVHVAGWPR